MKKESMPFEIPLSMEKETKEGLNTVTQSANKTEETGVEPVKKTQKFFTQEEVNALILKATKNMPSKNELREFKEWKESKKTNDEHLKLLNEIEKFTNNLMYANHKSVVANAGVDRRFQKFVLSEVSKLEGDFEENLAKYLKENSQFLNTGNHKDTKNTDTFQKRFSQSINERTELEDRLQFTKDSINTKQVMKDIYDQVNVLLANMSFYVETLKTLGLSSHEKSDAINCGFENKTEKS